MTKTKLFLLNTFTSVFFSLIFKILYTWFNIFIANKAGSENMGIYALTMTVYFTLVTFSQSGINLACCRITSEEIASGNEAAAIKTVRNCILYGLFCSFVAVFFTVKFSSSISSFVLHGKISERTVISLSVSLPFIAVCSAINGYFTAKRRILCVSLCQFLENITQVVLSVILITFIPFSTADEICFRLILSSCISQILSTSVYVILYSKERRNAVIPIKQSNTLKKMFKIIIPVSLSSHIKSILSGIKHSLIPKSLGKYQNNYQSPLSIYGTINSMVMPIITFPSFLFSSVSNILIPEIATLKVLNNNKKIAYIFNKIFKYTMIFSVFAIFILFSFSFDISILFYKTKNAGKYICLLCFVIPFIYLDAVTDAILKGINKQTAVVLINIADTILSIVLIYILLPIYGEKGYIFVIYISEIFNGFASLYVLKKAIKFKTDITNSLIKPVISAFIAFFILNFIKVNTFISLLLYTSVYFSLLFLFKGIRFNEIKIF